MFKTKIKRNGGFVVKNTIFGRIGEFLCPYSCISCGKVGGLLCNCCKKYIISKKEWKCLCCGGNLESDICERCKMPFLRQFCLGERQELLKDLIYVFKYQSVRCCAVVFANLFFDVYGDFLRGKVIIPLPTINKHIRERGFDHTDKLAKMLAWRCGGKCKKLLIRCNNAVQVGTDAETRKKQAESAYRAAEGVNSDTEYVLIDDVWTTGSSMMAACEVMQKAGARKISVVIIAKSR